MMSKNSFWANMRENLKRRNWIAVIYSVIFLLAFPVGLTLWITSSESQKELITLSEWKEYMNVGLSGYLSVNPMVTLLVTVLAVICGVQGFSYLFRRQKMDMYMSVPVSKERRFAVIYLNGILLFAIPYLFSLLIGVCISAANGILTAVIIKSMIFSYLAYIVYYTAVYNITIIAVMLTGNMLVSLCATGVFIFYEIVVKAIFSTFCSAFLHTYSYYSTDYSKVYFSPVIMMMQKSVFSGNEVLTVPRLIEQTGMTIGKIAIITVVTGIVGYLLYAIRPAESCNRAIAFGKTKPVIKVAVMVPIALIVGALFYSITNANIAMTVFGFVIGIILSHCMMEIIFAFDLKAAVKHLPSGAVAAAIVFGVFAVFHFDLTGYDKWVPNPEKVESIAIDIPVLQNNCYYDFENQGWIDSTDYCFEHMVITDAENVCAFMESVMADETEEEEKLLWATVKYRMKNGSEKYRSVYFSIEKHMDELNNIVVSEEYQKGAFQILDEQFNDKMKLKKVEFSNGVWSKEIKSEDMEMVYENYKADLAHYNMKTVVDEYPIGTIYVEFKVPGTLYEQTQSYSMPIYSSFEKTVAYANENNCLEDWKTKTDAIEVITICRWDENTYETEEKNFTSKEEIEAILPAIYPGEFASYRYFLEDEGYSYDAYVSFNSEDGEEWASYGSYFQVQSSLLPDFAK